MIGKEINSCKKCRVCTGCGRGAKGQESLQAVSVFAAMDTPVRENSEQKDNSTNTYIALPEGNEKEMLIAVDIGTTTIVMQLRRVQDGKVLDTFRATNPQRKYGMDILSRIQAAGDTTGSNGVCTATDIGSSHPSTAADMQSMVLGVLQQGISRFLDKVPGGDIKGMVIAANTTMIHLLMGYPVNTLGKAPFVAEHLEEIQTTIAGIPTVIMPGFSAFVGADVLAGVYACETHFSKMREPFLFLDLGTNGEIVLGTGTKMFATATAAGPAFEGRLDANVYGADAIRFFATLYEKGLVDETGLLADEYFETGVTIGSTVVTQADIRSLQLAKAAISAGIRVLSEEIDNLKVYLAGGFGYFLNSKDAVTIGLLPKELEANCISVGNAALEGAFCYGRERLSEVPDIAQNAYKKAVAMKEKTEVINLANVPSFEKYYVESMNLPCISKD